MRALVWLWVLAVVPVPVTAQVTQYEVPGQLQATQNPGCIAPEAAGPGLTPPDLLLGMQDCLKRGDYDAAVRMMILWQLRAQYDARRVSDQTARAATGALNAISSESMSARQQAQMQKAFQRFGGDGSPAHREICQIVRASGPPNYVPDYMILHGLRRVGDGLVAGFRPKREWRGLLRDYLKCAAR